MRPALRGFLESGICLGIAEIFCQLADFYPDGITFDAEGNLLVTLCGGGTLAVVSPTGQIVGSITTGGKGWTNGVFGGDDFQAFYLIEDEQQALLSTRGPIPGQHRYSRSFS
jgi:gluconolactonase